MLNFASLFNNFRSQSNSGLNDLLEQANVKMGRLLEEESFINEYKSGNSRITQFMKYDKFVELIQYITVVGPADDKKRSYKHPLSACQLLSVENSNTIEFFFPEKPLTVDQKVFQQVQVEFQQDVQMTPEQIESLGPQAQEASPVAVETASPQPKTQEKKAQEQKSENEESSSNQEEAKQAKVEEAPSASTGSESQQTTQAQSKVQVQVLTKVQSQVLEQVPVQLPVIPVVKRYKKVQKKQKQMIEKLVPKQVQPLLNRLLAYFDSQINYTLAGYVAKVLSVFFNKKTSEALNILLNQNIAAKILDHAQSRSIGDLIVKILIHETNLSLDKRRNFFKSILNRLSVNSQVHIMSNLSAYVCEIIQKIAANLKGNNKIVQFNQIFFSLDVITQVIRNVISDEENVCVYNAPILFTYLTNVPFVLPEDQTIVEQFKKLIESFIEKGIQKLTVNSRSRPKIGGGRVKIIQIFRFILKENILNTRDIVAQKSNFFSTLINLIRQYPLNNLLHNEILKIFDIALSQAETSKINQSILRDNVLLNFITQQIQQDKNIKAGASVYKFRKGFIAHVINLSMRLKELAESNSALRKNIQAAPFEANYENFVDKQIFKAKKSLAGFSMRKDIKHEIMFQKQDIISNYVTFLQKCPPPVFDEPEPIINIQHPDLVQQLQKQLEQNLIIKPKDQQQKRVDVEESGVASAQAISPAFVYHLHYDNIDALMNDL